MDAPGSWHAQSVEQTFSTLKVNAEGLSAAEAQSRLAQYGPNRLPEAKARSPLLRFLAQLHNVLIYVLLAAAAVTAFLGHWVDTGVILGVVLANALIGFVQEGKAEDALRAIRQMLSPRAMVLRDNRRHEVDAAELVPGDIVLLQSGDRVPADLRLFRAKSLQIQEAILTGESMPVTKSVQALTADRVLGDRRCIAYSGTLVTYGQGSGIVIATGPATEIGRISTLVAGIETLTTPLIRQIDRFAHWLTGAILTIAAATFAFGLLLRGYQASDMFLAAVGLAVAAIPEGLPAIITITLAIGVQRMAQRRAIIRRLPAVETLGAVSIICSDKTGTLTCNEMTVRNIATGGRLYELEGTGYNPHGAIRCEGRELFTEESTLLLQNLRAAALCNDATLAHRDGSVQVNGDPMEGALLVAALKAGLEPDSELKRYPRTDLIPFESQHRFMATLHHSHAGQAFIYLKGAPERVLAMCTQQRSEQGDETLDPAYWQALVEELAGRGQRVLAVAVKETCPQQMELDFGDVKGGLVLLGLFGLIDPPREEVIEAVGRCHSARIRVAMITGDHAITARAIARHIGLANSGEVLTGQELDALDEAGLKQRTQSVNIYARVSPEHKLLLVQQLQAQGLIVAMTGDGVNDAPALKQADVGIAMGHKGTEAAKEASEMVLADDNFASITNAVEEGRTVYDNIKKAILFILPTNGGEALSIIAAILIGLPQLPLTPLQILWVNMITAVTLALALAFEPAESDIMQRPPRPPRSSMLPPLFLWRIAFVSVVMMSGTFGLFNWEMARGATVEEARTVAVNTLVMFEIFYLFNARYILAPVLNRAGLFGSRYVLLAVGLLLLAQLAFTYTTPLQTLFGTTAIGAERWLQILLVASSVLFLVEMEKALARRVGRRRQRTPDAG